MCCPQSNPYVLTMSGAEVEVEVEASAGAGGDSSPRKRVRVCSSEKPTSVQTSVGLVNREGLPAAVVIRTLALPEDGDVEGSTFGAIKLEDLVEQLLDKYVDWKTDELFGKAIDPETFDRHCEEFKTNLIGLHRLLGSEQWSLALADLHVPPTILIDKDGVARSHTLSPKKNLGCYHAREVAGTAEAERLFSLAWPNVEPKSESTAEALTEPIVEVFGKVMYEALDTFILVPRQSSPPEPGSVVIVAILELV